MAENFTIEANDEVENFEVDFGEVTRVSNNDFNRLENRPSYAGEVMTGETSIPEVPSAVSELANDANYQTGAQVATAVGAETTARENADTALDNRLTTVEGIAGTALQPEAINKVVMTDIAVGANTSTTTFNLEAAKENLLTGATSSKQVSMPVASSTEAGIMNSSTFDAVSNNTNNVNALLNGAVAITGLPAEPTQAQLTTAWETATGATALMNRAGIYDVTNGKVWTYYTNSSTWYSVTNTTQVTINTFTNNSEGTIKGSTNVGQIFAETDGTGSVNGWDALNDAVSNNTSDVADLKTALGGKQDKLIAGANISIASDGKTISATDTTYTAGSGINISAQNVISTDAPEGFFTLSATVEGEGSEITLNNTIGAKLDEVQVDGVTFQQTYSGKNLLDPREVGSTTINNVVFTVDDTGRVTANGTASANTYFSLGTPTLPAGDYMLSGLPSSGSGSSFKITFTFEGVQQNCFNVNGKSFTLSAEATATEHYLFIANGYTANNLVFEPMIEAGSSKTSYELYVGGIPAPNPDYPQDIHTVTGEQTVTVTRKNILPFSNEDFTISNVRFYIQNGNIYMDGTASGNISSNNTVFRRNFAWILPAGTYVMSIDNYDYDPSVQFFLHKSDQSDIVSIGGNTAQSKTFTLTEDTGVYIGVYCAQGKVFQNKLLPIQIEVGSNASPYESFHYQGYDVDLRGKNILNISDFAMGGLSNGNPTTSNYRIQNANHPIAVQPNTTYTLSAQLASPVQGFRVGIHEIGRDGRFLRDLNWQQLGTGAFTMTTNYDTYYLKMVGSLSTTSTNVTTGGTENTTSCSTVTEFMRGCTLQFELGNTATTYTPYSPIELCKIGEYQDYVYKIGDDWYVHKETAKDVLPTSGYTRWDTEPSACIYYQNYDIPGALFEVAASSGLCKDFVTVPQQDNITSLYNTSFINSSYGLGLKVATHGFAIQNKDCANVTAFHTWIEANPVTLYYNLATPTDTKITDATLVGQLEALWNAMSYNGQTNFVVTASDSGALPAILEVKAYQKSLNGLLGAIERVNE